MSGARYTWRTFARELAMLAIAAIWLIPFYEKATLPVAIYSFVGQFASQWNHSFAAVIVAVLPILAFYLFAQRQLIQGLTGGIKS